MLLLSSDGHILSVDQAELDQNPKLRTLFWPCVAISLVHVIDAIGYAVQGNSFCDGFFIAIIIQ